MTTDLEFVGWVWVGGADCVGVVTGGSLVVGKPPGSLKLGLTSPHGVSTMGVTLGMRLGRIDHQDAGMRRMGVNALAMGESGGVPFEVVDTGNGGPIIANIFGEIAGGTEALRRKAALFTAAADAVDREVAKRKTRTVHGVTLKLKGRDVVNVADDATRHSVDADGPLTRTLRQIASRARDGLGCRKAFQLFVSVTTCLFYSQWVDVLNAVDEMLKSANDGTPARE